MIQIMNEIMIIRMGLKMENEMEIIIKARNMADQLATTRHFVAMVELKRMEQLPRCKRKHIKSMSLSVIHF